MSGFDFSGLTASFSGERVIGPLSLRVNTGEQVALVGKSGAGKSTLIRLIHDRVNREASLVPQELGLVNALPVFHNVFMGQLDRHATWYSTLTLIRPFSRNRAEVSALLKTLGMAEKIWVPTASLSGGQRQRVAIARTLLKDAPILALDEATSALDSEVELAIQESLFDLMQGKTVIAIAHRLSTIAAMDRLIVMDKGRIIEEGSHQELLERGGLYAQLWEHQSGGFLSSVQAA